MATAERQRQLRRIAAANGRCSTCRIHPPREGLRTCVHCATKDERTYLKQVLFNACCQATDWHRFDCREARPEQRGKGPFLPTKPPSAADLRRAS